jgi:hypothetical protein
MPEVLIVSSATAGGDIRLTTMATQAASAVMAIMNMARDSRAFGFLPTLSSSRNIVFPSCPSLALAPKKLAEIGARTTELRQGPTFIVAKRRRGKKAGFPVRSTE